MPHAAPSDATPPRTGLAGAALYLALVSVAAVVMGIVLAVLGPRPAAFAVVYGYMLTPALACILVRLIRREGFADAGLRLGPRRSAELSRAQRLWLTGRWYLLAWGVAVGGTALVYLVLWALGEARFDLSWDRVLALAPPGSARKEPPAWLGEERFMVLAALANVTVMLAPGMVLGLGEELGWRGYLLPRFLSAGIGVWPAVILTGLIWALWHIPLNLILPARVPWWLGIPAGLIAAVCVGAVFAWLRARSGSIFVVALAHIAFNSANSAAVLLFDVPPAPFLIGLVSLTVVLLLVLVAMGEMRRVRDITQERTPVPTSPAPSPAIAA